MNFGLLRSDSKKTISNATGQTFIHWSLQFYFSLEKICRCIGTYHMYNLVLSGPNGISSRVQLMTLFLLIKKYILFSNLCNNFKFKKINDAVLATHNTRHCLYSCAHGCKTYFRK